MAFNKITNATYLATDWQSEITSKNLLKKGYLAASFTEMGSSALPLLASGSAIDIGGILYQCDTNVTPTTTGSANGVNYLYVYDSGGVGVANIETTVPTYDYLKLGYYSSNKRAILKLYKYNNYYIDKILLDGDIFNYTQFSNSRFYYSTEDIGNLGDVYIKSVIFTFDLATTPIPSVSISNTYSGNTIAATSILNKLYLKNSCLYFDYWCDIMLDATFTSIAAAWGTSYKPYYNLFISKFISDCTTYTSPLLLSAAPTASNDIKTKTDYFIKQVLNALKAAWGPTTPSVTNPISGNLISPV